MCVKSCFTVLFAPPFWIGLYERWSGGKYEVCKITFGAEPKDYEVYAFLLRHWNHLTFSPAIPADTVVEAHVNPKRMQREISRQMQERGIGTKAQQALQLQHEENKTERQARSKAQQAAEEERQFMLRQEKRKAKHRGH